MIVPDPLQQASGAPSPMGCWRDDPYRRCCNREPVSDLGLCAEHLEELRRPA